MAKTVSLSRQYVVGSAVFDSLTFREPKLSDYRQLGKVVEVQRGVAISHDDALWNYVDRLVQDVPPGALSELDLADTLAIEDAIISFFSDANKALAKRASLSSGSAGAPPTSTD